MAISSIGHRGCWYEIFGARGKKAKSVSDSIGGHQKHSSFMENKEFFTYTAIAACMICAIAVAFNVFTDLELPGRIMAAILGVVITATITQVLL